MMLRALTIAAVLAGSAAGAEEVYRLSPAERDAAIAAGARRTDTDTPALLPSRLSAGSITDLNGPSLYADEEGKPDKKIHGEVGMFVGTGGARGFFGTAVVPLGEQATAVLSFSQAEGRGFGYGPYGYGGFGGGFGFGSPYDYPFGGYPIGRRQSR